MPPKRMKAATNSTKHNPPKQVQMLEWIEATSSRSVRLKSQSPSQSQSVTDWVMIVLVVVLSNTDVDNQISLCDCHTDSLSHCQSLNVTHPFNFPESHSQTLDLSDLIN